jgi:hypothetical protein
MLRLDVRMRTLLAAAVIGIALAAPLAAGAASPVQFRSPTGNIGCAYYNAALRCDVRDGLVPRPPRPAGCPSFTDYGQGLSLNARGTSVVCAGDTALGAGSVLPYGRTWHRGSITCVSRSTGFTRTNASGRGFYIARGVYRRF